MSHAYFITICVYDNQHLFSRVENDKSLLTDAGLMAGKWWLELENKFKHIKLYEYIIMPNHMHGIIIISESSVGDGLRAVPQDIGNKLEKEKSLSIPDIIHWFKTMSTNEYIRGVKQNIYSPFKKHLWQRSYYDRIIRNEKELKSIREYIYYNPLKWDWEKNHPENLS